MLDYLGFDSTPFSSLLLLCKLDVISKTSASVSSVSKHEKIDESTPSAFIVFECWKPDEAQSTSFCNYFSDK